MSGDPSNAVAGGEVEIEPYIVYRLLEGQLECATWTLQAGHKALALFLNEETARAYLASAKLPPEWKPFRPHRDDLLQILRHCHTSGIQLVALDPDHEKALRLFDIEQVLKMSGG